MGKIMRNNLTKKAVAVILTLVLVLTGFGGIGGVSKAHAADTTSFTGTIVWDGGGTHNSATELEGKLLLYRDFERGGKAISDMVQSDEYSISWSGDSFTIANLPSADDEGNEYTYWISQDSIEFYETTYSGTTYTHSSGGVFGIKNGGTITNKYQPNFAANDFMTVTVTKTWDDNKNAAGDRPSSLQIYLVQENNQSYRAGTMTGDMTADTWTYVFSNVPVYRDAARTVPYNYSVREVVPEGYVAAKNGKATQSNGEFEPSLRENYTYVADGQTGTTKDTSSLKGVISPSGSNDGNLLDYVPAPTIQLLPEKINFSGEEGVDYTVSAMPSGFSIDKNFARIYGTDAFVPVIVYRFSQRLNKYEYRVIGGEITVVYKDAAITANGYADVKIVYKDFHVQGHTTNNMDGTIGAVSFTSGYEAFCHVDGTRWSGIGIAFNMVISVLDDSGQPLKNETVLLTFKNLNQPDWTRSYSDTTYYYDGGTNTYMEKICVKQGAKSAAYITEDSVLKNGGIKSWESGIGDDGTCNGYEFRAAQNTAGGFKSGFAVLVDAEEFQIQHRNSYHDDQSGKSHLSSRTAFFDQAKISSATASLTNKHVPKSNVTIEKIWDDANDEAGMRPESITLHLYKDKYVSGSTEPIAEEVASKTIKKSNNWPDMTISDLPVEDAEGNRINYYVIEESIPGYETRYDSGSGYVKVDEQGHKFNLTEGQDTTVNVKNMIVGETNKVTVKKEWQDDNDEGNKRPGRVTIRLYEYVYNSTSGKYEGPFPVEGKDPLVLTPSNNWAGEWTGLQATKGGKPVFFNVEEDQVANYRPPTITRDQLNGFVVINSRDLDTKTYKVVFNDNASNFSNVAYTEHSPSDQNVTAGANAVAPSPSPKGEDEDGNKKVVSGWYKETACENEFNFNTEAINNNTTLYAKWSDDKNGNGIPDEDETKYSVTYKYADGSPTTAPPVPETLEDQLSGMEITVAADPTDIEDYVFDGWKVTTPASGTSISGGKFTMPEEDVFITGTWKADKNNDNIPDEDQVFTVRYMDGETELAKVDNLIVGATTPEIDNPAKTDYYFAGWMPSVEGTVKAEHADADRVITYRATWKDDKDNNGVPDEDGSWTVTFNPNGKTFKTNAPTAQTVAYGEKAIEPTPPPTAEKAKFDGWYKEPDCTTVFDFDLPITFNETVYAKWLPDENENDIDDTTEPRYTVVYKDGESSSVFADKSFPNLLVDVATPAYGDADPVWHQHLFKAWTPTWKNKVAAADADATTKEIVYTATWAEDRNNDKIDDATQYRTITYTDGEANGASFTNIVYGPTEKLLDGDNTPVPTFTTPSEKPEWADHVFVGWNPQVAGTISGNATYTATWKDDKNNDGKPDDEQPYTVKFDANGKTFATNKPADQSVVHGEKASEPTPPPTAEKAIFAGWYKEPACSTSFEFDEGIIANTIIYAKWLDDENEDGFDDATQDHFTVTYTDGVDGEEVFPDEVHANVLVKLPTPEFTGQLTRTGYGFKGWQPSVAETVTADATYTATWFEDRNGDGVDDATQYRTVTYKDGDANGASFADIEYKEDMKLLDGDHTPVPTFTTSSGKPEWIDHVFAGWNPIVAGVIDGNAIYEAFWKDDKNNDGVPDAEQMYIVNFDPGTKTFKTNAPDDQIIVHGEKVMKPEKDPTAEKAIFDGWYKDTECKEAFDFDDPIVRKTSIYAKWLPDKNENGIPDDKEKIVATDEEGNPVTPDPDDPIVEPGSDPKPGDTFIDENGDEYEVLDVDEPNPTTGEMPITVGKILTVTFDLDGGTLEGQTGTFTVKEVKNHTIVIPSSVPTKEGYEFDYWEGSVYHPGDTYVVKDNHKFTAKWIKKSETPKNTDAKDSDKSKAAPTGDESNIALWIVLFVAASLGHIVARRRKRV